jgi:hypothetical protein
MPQKKIRRSMLLTLLCVAILSACASQPKHVDLSQCPPLPIVPASILEEDELTGYDFQGELKTIFTTTPLKPIAPGSSATSAGSGQ